MKKSVTKRWKFSTLNTSIPSEYCLTCFFWNVEQFLYTKYRSNEKCKKIKKKVLPKDESFQI